MRAHPSPADDISSSDARTLELPGGPPPGWRRPVSGNHAADPGAALVLLGRYVHRSRYLLDISQDRLAETSGVSQSVISRLEHARAPATRLDRFLLLTDAFGRVFPLGFCPHNHPCAWQPIRLPPPVDPERQRIQDLLIEHGLDYGRPRRGD